MRIVIDLELSSAQKRVVRTAVVVGAVIASLGLGVAVAMPKHTFTPSTPVRASDMNDNFNDLDTRAAALEAQRTVRARISASGAAISQSAGIANAPGHPSAGTYTIQFTSGFFSETPSCVATPETPNPGQPTVAVYGATAMGVTVGIVLSGAGANTDFSVVCVGPK
jgi:hypothetical protein